MVKEQTGKNDLPNPPKVDRTFKKSLKTFLVVFGYLGKNFYGFQIQKDQNGNETFETVEGKILKSLKITLKKSLENFSEISIENFDFLQKWSKTARTDKGVSAAVNAISVELPLGFQNLQENFIENWQKKLNELLENDQIVEIFGLQRVTKKFDARFQCDRRLYEFSIPISGVFENEQQIDLEKFNRILKKFEGTKNYHNFTRGVKAGADQSKRFVLKCQAKICEGFLTVEILGQSFLYNQIRKMVDLSVRALLGFCEENFIDDCLNMSNVYNLHIAPGEGLFLSAVYFEGYNANKIIRNENSAEFERIEVEKSHEFQIEKMRRRIRAEILENWKIFADWIEKMKTETATFQEEEK